MLILKILGGIDLTASIAFLMLTFGLNVPVPFIIFCAVLLLIKGLFILTGDVLSVIDILASFLLLISLFFYLPIMFLWTPAFFLLAKGFVSFI